MENTATAPDDPLVGKQTGTESSLSNWAGDYVTDLLGRGQALSQAPYQAYDGPLTAGASDLQNQAFQGIAGLVVPEGYGTAADMTGDIYDQSQTVGDYDPNTFSTGLWNNDWAEKYMDPYLQQALDPQLEELRRQAEITRLNDNARLTQAGAYGGSRQALMNSELNDNTARLMAELTGKGYSDAYNTAGQLFTSDMARQLQADRASEQSRQFGSNQGIAGLGIGLNAANSLSNITDAELRANRGILDDTLRAGDVERGITSEGIAADYGQFREERDYPYNQVNFAHSLLSGMPLATNSYSYAQPSDLSNILSGATGTTNFINTILEMFGQGGNESTTTPS